MGANDGHQPPPNQASKALQGASHAPIITLVEASSFFTLCRHEIQRHLVEEALHAQQRRKMRLIEDRPGYVQQVTQALAQERFARKPRPS